VSASSPFSSDERARLDAAIAEIERRTGAHLALVVTRVSDRYSLYPLVWAGSSAIVATGLIALLWPVLDDRTTIFIELLLLLVLALLFDWMPIRLAIVPDHVKHAHARQLAHREFASHRAHDDPDRRRILLFVSLAERYVEVVADHATHADAPGIAWHKIVDDFLSAIKAGRLAEGALAALAACATILGRGQRRV
jgi:putative membrane protein